MANIRKRGDRWQVQVRRKGAPPTSRTFFKKQDAELWARQTEVAADRRELPIDPACLDRLTLGDIITRYRDTISPKKRGHEIECFILNAFLRHRLALKPLSTITGADFATYRDERLRTVQAATINRELGLLHHVCAIARAEWDVPLPSNPLDKIRKPKAPPPRDRRLEPGELETLLSSAAKGRNKHMGPLIRLALETAMRRGELLNIRWQDIDWDRRTLHIPTTKNGHPRTIPLTPEAIAILRELQKGGEEVFPMTVNAARLAWQRLIRRTNIGDLHFHDLRHEAISRFFELGLSVPEVALISGHRDFRMLFRYTHLRPEDIAAKLAT